MVYFVVVKRKKLCERRKIVFEKFFRVLLVILQHLSGIEKYLIQEYKNVILGRLLKKLARGANTPQRAGAEFKTRGRLILTRTAE